nr:hypothetical protein [uncultured Bdellovibrio sp.]
METTPNDFKNSIGNIKENVKKGVKQELQSSGWEDRYHAVQDKEREAMDVSEDFVKAHPYYTILGAATVGFVAGMLIRRNQ